MCANSKLLEGVFQGRIRVRNVAGWVHVKGRLGADIGSNGATVILCPGLGLTHRLEPTLIYINQRDGADPVGDQTGAE